MTTDDSKPPAGSFDGFAAPETRVVAPAIRIHLWHARGGWVMYTANEYAALPDLDAWTTMQRAVLNAYSNVSSVTGPHHGAVDLSAEEAAATGVAYTFESTEGRRRLAAIARQYEPMVAGLLAEIESADRAADVAASATASARLDHLKQQISADLKAEKDAQRTNLVLAVAAETKRVRRAVGAVESLFPEIGSHLRARLRWGFEVVYEPLPPDRIVWIGSAPRVCDEVDW